MSLIVMASEQHLIKVYIDSPDLICGNNYYLEKDSSGINREENFLFRGLVNDSCFSELNSHSEKTLLCEIALYDSDMLVAQYDNMRIRNAVPNANNPSYDYFNQLKFLDHTNTVYPIVHIFRLESISDIRSRFYRVADSSIWNYSIFWKYDSNDPHFDVLADSLKNVFLQIVKNIKLNLYNLAIAQEYVDLNARLTKQAYISFGYGDLFKKQTTSNTGNNDHGDLISPFLFHSESGMKQKREFEEARNIDGVFDLSRYKWRALLLDDKINEEALTPSELGITKEKILKDRIDAMFGVDACSCVYFEGDYESKKYLWEELFSSDTISEKNIIVVLCVDTIEKAEFALKHFKFDFIFLDYLLKKEKGKQRYGYELLDTLDKTIGKDGKHLSEMNKSDGSTFVVGPDQRFFFMFISAFTTAISERLRLQGWARSEEIWYIAEGACPTNTPQLFCYNLRKMMIKRIKDSGVEKLSTVKIFDLVWDVYLPLQQDPQRSSVRKRAIEHYQDFMSLLYIYHRILKDVEIPKSQKSIFTTRGSVFMTSLYIRHNHLGGLLEHLSQLVHLTAFGTVRQWPEMWEEYLFFKAQFQDLYNDPNELQEIEKIDIHKLYDNIEQHILGLKSL